MLKGCFKLLVLVVMMPALGRAQGPGTVALPSNLRSSGKKKRQ
jgi:hypothetical protein